MLARKLLLAAGDSIASVMLSPFWNGPWWIRNHTHTLVLLCATYVWVYQSEETLHKYLPLRYVGVAPLTVRGADQDHERPSILVTVDNKFESLHSVDDSHFKSRPNYMWNVCCAETHSAAKIHTYAHHPCIHIRGLCDPLDGCDGAGMSYL